MTSSPHVSTMLGSALDQPILPICFSCVMGWSQHSCRHLLLRSTHLARKNNAVSIYSGTEVKQLYIFVFIICGIDGNCVECWVFLSSVLFVLLNSVNLNSFSNSSYSKLRLSEIILQEFSRDEYSLWRQPDKDYTADKLLWNCLVIFISILL